MAKEKSRAASTRALLDAGIEAFSAKGYDATTTKEIARIAGLNEQLITRYFGGKMGLLVAAYQDLLEFQEDDRAYELSPLQDSIRLELEIFFHHKIRHFIATRKLMSIVLVRLLFEGDRVNRYDLSFINRMVNVLAGRLVILQKGGKIRSNCDIPLVSRMIVQQAFMNFFLEPAILGESAERMEYDQNRIVAIFEDYLRP